MPDAADAWHRLVFPALSLCAAWEHSVIIQHDNECSRLVQDLISDPQLTFWNVRNQLEHIHSWDHDTEAHYYADLHQHDP